MDRIRRNRRSGDSSVCIYGAFQFCGVQKESNLFALLPVGAVAPGIGTDTSLVNDAEWTRENLGSTTNIVSSARVYNILHIIRDLKLYITTKK